MLNWETPTLCQKGFVWGSFIQIRKEHNICQFADLITCLARVEQGSQYAEQEGLGKRKWMAAPLKSIFYLIIEPKHTPSNGIFSTDCSDTRIMPFAPFSPEGMAKTSVLFNQECRLLVFFCFYFILPSYRIIYRGYYFL